MSNNVPPVERKNSSKIKTNGYSSHTLHAIRNRKRQESDERKEHHDKLSIKQKIELAQNRSGKSKKEIERLTQLLAGQEPTEIRIPSEKKKEKKVSRKILKNEGA